MVENKKPEDIGETVEFMGEDIDINKVDNPHLRRAIRNFSRNAGFRFCHNEYGDHSRQTKPYKAHSDWHDKYHEAYHDYSDYRERRPGYNP